MVRGKGGSAGALGMGTGAAVSQQLAKWRNRAESESAWRNLATRIDRRLKNAVKY
jgi:hypothetical protein